MVNNDRQQERRRNMYCSIDLNYCLRNNYCPNGLDLHYKPFFDAPG